MNEDAKGQVPFKGDVGYKQSTTKHTALCNDPSYKDTVFVDLLSVNSDCYGLCCLSRCSLVHIKMRASTLPVTLNNHVLFDWFSSSNFLFPAREGWPCSSTDSVMVPGRPGQSAIHKLSTAKQGCFKYLE